MARISLVSVAGGLYPIGVQVPSSLRSGPGLAGPGLGPERIKLLEPHEWLLPLDVAWLRWFVADERMTCRSRLGPKDRAGFALELMTIYARRRFLPRETLFRAEYLDPLWEPAAAVVHSLFPNLLLDAGFMPRIATSVAVRDEVFESRWSDWRWEVHRITRLGVDRICQLPWTTRERNVANLLWRMRRAQYSRHILVQVNKARRGAEWTEGAGQLQPLRAGKGRDAELVADTFLLPTTTESARAALYIDGQGRVGLGCSQLRDAYRSKAGAQVFSQRERASLAEIVDLSTLRQQGEGADTFEHVCECEEAETILTARREAEAAFAPDSLERRVLADVEALRGDHGIVTARAREWSVPLSTLHDACGRARETLQRSLSKLGVSR